MKTEERVLRLENAFSTLAELARTQSERTDETGRPIEILVELAATQSARLDEAERRTELLVELATTQSERMDEYERRTEELAQAQKELAEAQKELTEAQKQTEANLSALTVIMADLGRAMTNLSERFDKHVGDN